MMKPREDLVVSDLFKNSNKDVLIYSSFSMSYKQDSCLLYRFPELYELLSQSGIHIEYSSFWKNWFRMINKLKDRKKVLFSLYSAFSECPGISIIPDIEISVTSVKKYTNESFKLYRNRKLFQLRDELGISHEGKGDDSIRLKWVR